MNKICTSLEQSKKLIELGISFNTADMGWNVFVDNTIRLLPIDDWDLVKDGSGNVKFYPAWSFTALLNIIPKRIEDFNILRIDIAEKDFSMWYDEIGYGVNTELPDITMECPVDVAFEMVCWLKENKKI